MSQLLTYCKKRNIRPLNREDINTILLAIINGDEQAKEEYIIKSVWYINFIINKHIYHNKQHEDDLMSLGVEVVMKALEKLTIDKIDTFPAYLFICIKYNLMNYIQRQRKYTDNVIYIHSRLDECEEGTFEFFLKDTKIDINKYVSKIDYENAIKQMTELEMQIIVKSCIECLSTKEISHKLKMKQTDIRFIKDCAIKKLTKLLSDYIDRDIDENFNTWAVIADKIS